MAKKSALLCKTPDPHSNFIEASLSKDKKSNNQ